MTDDTLGEGNDCLLDHTSSCEVAADLSVLRLYLLILPFTLLLEVYNTIQDNQSIIIIKEFTLVIRCVFGQCLPSTQCMRYELN